MHDTVTVLVGAQQKPILVHEDRICKTSKVLKAACSKEWTTGEARVVRLPDEEPIIFSAYAHWTYTGTLLATSNDLKGPRSNEIVAGYLLGDRLEDVQYRNYTTDRLITRSKEAEVYLKASAIVLVYNSTPQNSLLRRLLVDQYVACRAPNLRYQAHGFPHDFVRDVAVAALEFLPLGTIQFAEDRSKYLEAAETAGGVPRVQG
ncbi:hypothetical protein LTR95_014864 [Oleoguttula sp. CCFEE 5521]